LVNLCRLFNAKLENNPEQVKAVTNIVLGTSRPAPYLIFGPPGTGKTVTVVEAMKQVTKCYQLKVKTGHRVIAIELLSVMFNSCEK
jgi:Cdc6-like AAA superfamily ATPase